MRPGSEGLPRALPESWPLRRTFSSAAAVPSRGEIFERAVVVRLLHCGARLPVLFARVGVELRPLDARVGIEPPRQGHCDSLRDSLRSHDGARGLGRNGGLYRHVHALLICRETLPLTLPETLPTDAEDDDRDENDTSDGTANDGIIGDVGLAAAVGFPVANGPRVASFKFLRRIGWVRARRSFPIGSDSEAAATRHRAIACAIRNSVAMRTWAQHVVLVAVAPFIVRTAGIGDAHGEAQKADEKHGRHLGRAAAASVRARFGLVLRR